MTDAEFTHLCGTILRGTSLFTACELLELDVREVLAQIENDPRLLSDLYSAMAMRARMMEHTPAE
jgi:hypothetical protein